MKAVEGCQAASILNQRLGDVFSGEYHAVGKGPGMEFAAQEP